VLSRILGPKRDEIIGEWRKLCKEELIANGMGGACSTYKENETLIQGFVRKPEGK
jgi:hypothetical protein